MKNTRNCTRLFEESTSENVAMIYLDELYCNEKHAVCKVDDQCTWSVEVKGGRRLCFCTAFCEMKEISPLDRESSVEARDPKP